MRTGDTGTHPAIKKRRTNSIIGAVAVVIGGAIALIPLIQTGTIELVSALLSLGFVLAGGLLLDPKSFQSIAERSIDRIPGGGE